MTDPSEIHAASGACIVYNLLITAPGLQTPERR